MKKKILIVDDEVNILKVLRFYLTNANYEVVTTGDGAIGIQQARSLKPDLLILDIMMPKVDGPAIAQAVREFPETKDTPIIFLTGLLSKNEQKGERRTEGGDYLVAKPIDKSELLSLIQKLLA
jgi:DNA-binding response OmpR family regulator